MEKYYAKNIASLREKAGVTQDQLAKEMGVYTIEVGKWENGENEPTKEQYDKLASFFRVPAETIQNSELTLTSTQNIAEQAGHIESILGGVSLLLALVVFCVLQFAYSVDRAWVAFIYALPFGAFLTTIFFMAKQYKFNSPRIVSLVSTFIWTLALSIFLTFLTTPYMWLSFIVALALQLILLPMLKMKR